MTNSPGINSVIFYYGSYLIDELGNGDASGIYDSYGSPSTGWDWPNAVYVIPSGTLDMEWAVTRSYGALRTRVVSVVVGLYI